MSVTFAQDSELFANSCTLQACPDTDEVSWMQHESFFHPFPKRQKRSKPRRASQVLDELGPYNSHFDTTPDYLNIAGRASGIQGRPGSPSDNFYIVIGDAGGCGTGVQELCDRQKAVAALADQYVQQRKQKNPSSTLLFVLAVGDNFYWMGANAENFQSTWASVYSDELRSVPWFSVMGNHDIGNTDYGAACPFNSPRFSCQANDASAGCGGARPYSTMPQAYNSNQLDGNKGGAGGWVRANYNMPDFTYYYAIPDLSFEILAMDQNADHFESLGGNGVGNGAASVLSHCGSEPTMRASLESIKEASMQLLRERAAASAQNNIAIISHYPGNGFRNAYLQTAFQSARSPNVVSFYGHVHHQQCDSWVDGSCVEFLTGAGGGCCQGDGDPNGFVVMSWDDSMHQTTECFVGESPAGIPCIMSHPHRAWY